MDVGGGRGWLRGGGAIGPAEGGLVEGGRGMRMIAIRAALTVAAVYGYFLLFAQFAFVALVARGRHGDRMAKSWRSG